MSNLSINSYEFNEKNTSAFLNKLFQVHLREISVSLIQKVGLFLIFFVLVNHPLDYYIFSSDSFLSIVKWRLLISLNLGAAIVGVSYSKLIRKYFDCFGLLIFLLASFLTVFYTMHIDELANGPRYLICLLPLLSIIIPSNLENRITITLIPLLTLSGWMMLQGLHRSVMIEYSAVFLITLGSTISTILIGHFLFYRLNRLNFFQSRKLKLTQKEAEKARKKTEVSRRKAEEERKKSEDLLRNILPHKISDRLKDGENVSQNFEDVTVLFADIVEFTPLANELPAKEVVDLLDSIFSSFDDLTEEFGVEKIKTIGDEYFIASGVPEPFDDHAVRCADYALAIQDLVKEYIRHDDKPFQLRIGMNTGSLVAGIIGKEKFVYDVWGMTVNMGSRMETMGIPGEIQVTSATKLALEEQSNGQFEFEKRPPITIKGKGEVTSYFLRTKTT